MSTCRFPRLRSSISTSAPASPWKKAIHVLVSIAKPSRSALPGCYSEAHSMCQEQFFLLPGESEEQYQALHARWSKQYEMDQPAVPSLIDALVESEWIQQRCTRNVLQLQTRLAQAELKDPTNMELIEFLERRLHNSFRYRTAAENSFTRALRNLERFRKALVDEEMAEAYFDLDRLDVIERVLARRWKYDMPLDDDEDDTDEDDLNGRETDAPPQT